MRVTGLVEKPDPADAPSNLAIIGRYVLRPAIFDVLRNTPPGRGGEIQLTDALQERAAARTTGGGVHGVVFRGRRYDTGDRLDYLKAVVRLASEHRELGTDFSAWLDELRRRGGDLLLVITVEQHLSRILGTVRPLPRIDLGLLDAHDCVLAEDVASAVDLPGFDNSAMDGYAVRAADVAGATADAPVHLPVVGDIPAGNTKALSLAPGQSMRIMTGAPLPRGADAVVPVEVTDAGLSRVAVREATAVGQHVRAAGGDVRAGDVVLRAGMRLGPRQVGLLAAVGRGPGAGGAPAAGRRPVDRQRAGRPGHPSRLRAGGRQQLGSMLTAALRELGAVPFRVRRGPRRRRACCARPSSDELLRADPVITTGGVSAGAYDTVKEVLSRVGTMSFDKVAMQPGMPQGFGVLGEDAHADLHAAGQPGERLRVVRGVRRAGAAPDGGTGRPRAGAGRRHRRRTTGPRRPAAPSSPGCCCGTRATGAPSPSSVTRARTCWVGWPRPTPSPWCPPRSPA